ncbi:MAG: hypothetical protein AAF542_18350 [Pseudomonadota bacterium]
MEIKTALYRLMKGACAFAMASAAQAATLNIDIRNESGDSFATEQVIVSLHSNQALASSKASKRVHRIEQTGSQFKPFISAVQKGSSIKFPNRDRFAHHVYSFSEPAKFQSELYSQQESHEIEVAKTGVIVVGCNIHDWMLAYVYVVDTPHFGQALNKQVTFEQVEPGAYTLSYWHPAMPGPMTSALEVVDDAPQRIPLTINVKRIEQLAAPSHSFHEDEDY